MIDSHHHLWDLAVRDLPWLSREQAWASAGELASLRRSFTLAELAPLASAAGVTATVAIQTDFGTGETEDLLALTQSGGCLVTAVVGWVDLTAPDVADRLAALREGPGGTALRGIRHPLLAEPDPGWLARPQVRRGLSVLGDAGLVFDLALFARQLPGAVECARSVPGARFVLDHLGNPPAEAGDDGSWARAIGDLGALDNVACKLSGAHASPATADSLRPCYETVLAAFGPERLMFGSDWPVSALTAPYPEICGIYQSLTAGLSEPERDAIFDRTARRVYSLAG